jgi:hypothetical protein
MGESLAIRVFPQDRSRAYRTLRFRLPICPSRAWEALSKQEFLIGSRRASPSPSFAAQPILAARTRSLPAKAGQQPSNYRCCGSRRLR